MKLGIYWFRNDLRVQDNPLFRAAVSSVEQLLAVYVVDPSWFKPRYCQLSAMSYHRWIFIRQSLTDLAIQLKSLNIELKILMGEPVDEISQLMVSLQVDNLYCANQSGLYEARQLHKLVKRFPYLNLNFVWNNTLLSDVQLAAIGGIKGSFTDFRKRLEKKYDLDQLHQSHQDTSLLCDPDIHSPNCQSLCSLSLEEIDQQLKTANYAKNVDFIGGETAAQQHLQNYFSTLAPSQYKYTRNDLDCFASSTKISPWLAVGCLSPHAIWRAKCAYESQYGSNSSTYWIGFELLWREYFYWLSIKIGVNLFKFTGIRNKTPLTTFHPQRFRQWCLGSTPYPLVNACMKQLNQTGYMSNRGRQIVASCLVNELAIDWRYGAAYFEHQLLDYEVGSNWGNWQYIAGVGVDPRGGRHFNLVKQTSIYDPDEVFINKWHGKQSQLPLDVVDAADWPMTLSPTEDFSAQVTAVTDENHSSSGSFVN